MLKPGEQARSADNDEGGKKRSPAAERTHQQRAARRERKLRALARKQQHRNSPRTCTRRAHRSPR
jgi:hypothetical protein